MNFERFSDEELCEKAKEGDGKAENYLLNKYKNMVRSKAKTLYLLGGDREDLIQEGMIGLFMAVRDFDKTKNTWKEEKTELTPVVSGDNHTFTIPNVKERFLLTILTKVDADNYSSRFDNDAYVWWNNNIKFKTKLHASILDVHGGNGQIGTINKTANSQLAVSSDNAFDAGLGEYISNEPEWTMTADKNTVAAPGDYYMYDAFIFDKNVRVDSDTINSTNGYSLRKLGESSAATLASGISLEKLFSKK